MTTTATVTENPADVTELTITITNGDTEIDWMWLTTAAYNVGDAFNVDAFNADVFAADITAALERDGWAPAEPITVADDGTVTFAVKEA